MKKVLLFMLISYSCCAQTKHHGYGYFGATSFVNDKFGNRGGLVVAGGVAPAYRFAVGGGINVFLFKNKSEFSQAFGDVRFFFRGLDKKASPFLSVQPGMILYNDMRSVLNATVTTKGSFAINTLLGMVARPKKGMGFFFNVGYSNISFTAKSTEVVKKNYGGFKAELGIAF